MKKTIVAFLLCMHIAIASCTAQNNVLDATAFENGINTKDSVQILDVRTPAEYSNGHIKNALLADWNNKEEFDRRIAFIDKDKPVYVYCLAGGRSAQAAKKLKEQGYKNVFDLGGGINAWKTAGKAIEGKSEEKEMTTAAFDSAIHGSQTILIDFGAVWCPPCRKMEPVIKSLSENNPGRFSLLKVDGGKDETIMRTYNVTTLPVFIIFKEGKQVWRKEGIITEKELLDHL